MKTPCLIAGLGNPGREYVGTRHNAGYLVMERLGAEWGVVWESSRRFRSTLGRSVRHDRVVWLCRPNTFMNLSGEAVGPLSRFHGIEPQAVMVVVDDADLPLGTVRMRPDGSPGGHHGLESIEQHLGTREYGRQRIGIGRRSAEQRQITNHVLGRFESEERSVMERVAVQAVEQLECWVAEGCEAAMNRFNGVVADLEK
jgi:peptidyl-tRNA hydrolase, PTH1 family